MLREILRFALQPLKRYYERHLVLWLDMGGDAPPPPDYTPMANASKEAAEIGAQLGREQLAEGRRQYDQNMAVAKPIIEAQSRNMDQAYEQGNYSFQNFKDEGRPLQQAMRGIAMGKLSPEVQAQADQQARASVADVSGALDAQRTQSTRNMQRMGFNPNSGRMAAMNGVMDIGAAAAKAGAANSGRNQAVDRSYARMGDVLNTYSGMASSAPTFYQTATQSGNSAMSNQMAPGAGLMGAMSGAAGTTMQGRQMAMSGLGSVLSAQTSYANALASQDDGLFGALGTLGGAAITKWSDPRLKENIEAVGRDEETGLTIYEFNYLDQPEKRYRGVMADEVQETYPEAVVTDDSGYLMVNYALLGIEFEEVA
jgi:hypothetical protein